LLKASSLFLNFSASIYSQHRVYRIHIEILTIDHALNLARRKLADRVRNGDVGAASGCLLSSSDLQDTVDIDLENDLENRIPMT
jgi:hypothetical protein